MQQPGDPYIQRPDTVEVTEERIFCWLDLARVCGGDCVAFEPTKQPSNCRFLNSVHHLCRAVVVATKPRTMPGQTISVPPVGV